MRVIRRMKPPKKKEYGKKCYHCKSIFAYTEDDMEAEGMTDMGDVPWSVKCPVCEAYNHARWT